MNTRDKDLYKALKFYSILTVGNAERIKLENPSYYYNYTTKAFEDNLHAIGFIHFGNNKDVGVITLKGMEQLRILEDIKRKDLTLTFSIISG